LVRVLLLSNSLLGFLIKGLFWNFFN